MRRTRFPSEPPFPPLPDAEQQFRLRAARKKGDVNVLISALQDELSARFAARYLGDIAAAEAASVVRPLLESREPFNRSAAAKSLGKMRDRDSLPALLRLAREDPFPFVRGQSLIAAGAVGEVESLRGLLYAVLDDPHWETRFSAAEVLSRIGSTDDIERLKIAKRSDRLFRRGPYRRAIKAIRRRNRRM